MHVIIGLEQLVPPPTGSVLTVGNFDGVHAGHQEILKRARNLASNSGARVAALTFDPHPLTIVNPAKAPERLMSLSERVRCLGEAGADLVVVAQSSPELLKMEAEHFVEAILIAKFRPVHMVEGTSFGFGRGRKGTTDSLRDWLRPHGCHLHVVEPVRVAAQTKELLAVSSSLIRTLIQRGEVADANRCLCRPYMIESEVIHGAARGRTIGFPTANFPAPAGQVEPAEGVYAGITDLGGARHYSAISVGRAETFGESRRRLEAHLLDFQGDLYGRHIRVEFHQFIRGQKKFGSPEELIQQIRQDIQQTRAVLPCLKGQGGTFDP